MIQETTSSPRPDQERLAYLTRWLRRWAPELEARASEERPRPEGFERFAERLGDYERLVLEQGERWCERCGAVLDGEAITSEDEAGALRWFCDRACLGAWRG